MRSVTRAASRARGGRIWFTLPAYGQATRGTSAGWFHGQLSRNAGWQVRHSFVDPFPFGQWSCAQQTASALARSIGFDVVDAGGLKNARDLEPLASLSIYPGHGAGLGPAIAPTWIRRPEVHTTC